MNAAGQASPPLSLFEPASIDDLIALHTAMHSVESVEDEHLLFRVSEPSGRTGTISGFGDYGMFLIEINDIGLARAALGIFRRTGREVILFRDVNEGNEMTVCRPAGLTSMIFRPVQVGGQTACSGGSWSWNPIDRGH